MDLGFANQGGLITQDMVETNHSSWDLSVPSSVQDCPLDILYFCQAQTKFPAPAGLSSIILIVPHLAGRKSIIPKLRPCWALAWLAGS